MYNIGKSVIVDLKGENDSLTNDIGKLVTEKETLKTEVKELTTDKNGRIDISLGDKKDSRSGRYLGSAA